MDRAYVEEKIAALPLLEYHFLDTEQLLFSERVRYICETECPMYGKSWACPPGVGPVAQCMEKCRAYPHFLLIATICEVSDIANIEETLATRPEHEAVTRQVADIMKEAGAQPMVLSGEACAICEKCAWPEAPCRHPDQMYPCIESHGILVTMLAENCGIDFQYGGNVVTWFSVLFYKD